MNEILKRRRQFAHRRKLMTHAHQIDQLRGVFNVWIKLLQKARHKQKPELKVVLCSLPPHSSTAKCATTSTQTKTRPPLATHLLAFPAARARSTPELLPQNRPSESQTSPDQSPSPCKSILFTFCEKKKKTDKLQNRRTFSQNVCRFPSKSLKRNKKKIYTLTNLRE